jgi:hypothetical protein
MPVFCYWKLGSIAWLLLCHLFLVAYSIAVDFIGAPFPSDTTHPDTDILHFIKTISANINCELADFHCADQHLCNAIHSFDTDSDRYTVPFMQDFISASIEFINKIRELQITDLLLNDAMSSFEFTLFGEDDDGATCNDLPSVLSPSRHHA